MSTTEIEESVEAEEAEVIVPIQENEEESSEEDFLHKFASEYFLNKHSPSFVCLEQYLCSNSELDFLVRFFPPLLDPDLEGALNYVAPEAPLDYTGCERYKKMCKELEIVPITRIIKSLTTSLLDLKYYGLTLSQMRGISDALKVNGHVAHLILQDNWMSPEASQLISDILGENNTIKILNLRECRIGVEGAQKLSEGIAISQFLQELDLSFNGLGDKGLKMLQTSLMENTSIRKLNIGHNKLTEVSGAVLEKILLENRYLEELDLSWNGFYTGPGNKNLCKGLKGNETLKSLNLSWNGICTTACVIPIAKYLRTAKYLEVLDLSWNRIMETSFTRIRTAITRNKSLIKVKLGNNVYTPDEAVLLATILNNPTKTLQVLDMENMCVNKNIIPLAKNIARKGRVLIHGRILSNYVIRGPNVKKLLFERCKYLSMKPKKAKAKKDFGHFVLSLPDKKLPKSEIQALLKKKRVKKIDNDLLNELTASFPAKGQKVDCVSLKEAYMGLYPDTVLPEVVEKKKKGKKKKKK